MDMNREQLSCLMDGEVEARGAKFLVRRLASDSGMKQAWQRYHMVRSVLHQESTGPIDLASRVGEALDEEESPQRAGSKIPVWLRTATGGALAASVALAAIVGVNQNLLNLGGDEEVRADGPGFISQTTALDRQFTRQPVPVGFTAGAARSSGQADRERIHSYLVRHNQAGGGTGFISYTPILTARTEAAPETAVLRDQPEEDTGKHPEPAPR